MISFERNLFVCAIRLVAGWIRFLILDRLNRNRERLQDPELVPQLMINSDDENAHARLFGKPVHSFALPSENYPGADLERRGAARQKTIRCAVIACEDGTMDAAMMDISADGAKLRPVDETRVPARFDLLLPSREWRKCEVVRRTAAYVAVRFTD